MRNVLRRAHVRRNLQFAASARGEYPATATLGCIRSAPVLLLLLLLDSRDNLLCM